VKALLAALLLLAAPVARAQGLHSSVLDPPPAPGTQETVATDGRQGLKLATIGVLVGTATALIVWDVIVAANHGPTESQVITDVAWRYSVLPYVLGILIGHWLFTHSDPWRCDLWPAMAASVAVVLTWDLLIKKGDEHSLARYPGVWFAVGVPVGALLWGQRH
jgi:hypothetical protein